MTDLTSLLEGQLPAGLSDLVAKFDHGQHAQVSDSQVHEAYGQVASQLPQNEYVAAAEAAFAKLTPEQRTQFAEMLQTKGQQFGVSVPATQQAPTDPAGLAAATAAVHAEAPSLLQKMFAPGGTFSSPIAKAALLGITAMAAQRLMGNHA